MTNPLDPLPRRFSREGCAHVLESHTADGRDGYYAAGTVYYRTAWCVAPALEEHVAPHAAVMVLNRIQPRLDIQIDRNLIDELMRLSP